MDANALLKRQGWKGAGHSLDHRGTGLKKPLLITHKQDQLGLGKKKAAHNVDDQWWMRAFDESLKNIGTGQESTLSQVRKQGINRGGLYGFFVKGEGMPGTISNTEENSAIATDSSALSSRAVTPTTVSNDISDVSDSAVDVSADKTSVSKVKKSASLKRKREVGGEIADKRERTERKRQKKAVKEQEKSARREEKRRLNKEMQENAGDAATSAENKEQKQVAESGLSIAKFSAKAKPDRETNQHQAVLAAKITKLTKSERTQYEKRAASKNQSFEQYVLRRIQKKAEKKSK